MTAEEYGKSSAQASPLTSNPQSEICGLCVTLGTQVRLMRPLVVAGELAREPVSTEDARLLHLFAEEIEDAGDGLHHFVAARFIKL